MTILIDFIKKYLWITAKPPFLKADLERGSNKLTNHLKRWSLKLLAADIIISLKTSLFLVHIRWQYIATDRYVKKEHDSKQLCNGIGKASNN